MIYQMKNLILNVETDNHADMMGDCELIIPFKHKDFLKDACGMKKNHRWTPDSYEPIFEHEYGSIRLDDENYVTNSVDIGIAYMSWLLDGGDDVEVDVTYSDPFWAIHDVQHALNDESGCTVYVDGFIERERLTDAFEIMADLGHHPTHQLVEEIETGFRNRFKMPIDLTHFLETEDWHD